MNEFEEGRVWKTLNTGIHTVQGSWITRVHVVETMDPRARGSML